MTDNSLMSAMTGQPTGTQSDSTTSREKTNAKVRELSALGFVAAFLFTVIGLAAEAAGAHWYVGCLCVSGTFICAYINLRLNGWKLGGPFMVKE